MNTLNLKNISIALLLSMSAFFSVNTYAAETTSIENSISELVIAQGKQMMDELSEQLKQSISDEIDNITIDFSFNESLTSSLAWITDEESTSTNTAIDNNNEDIK